MSPERRLVPGVELLDSNSRETMRAEIFERATNWRTKLVDADSITQRDDKELALLLGSMEWLHVSEPDDAEILHFSKLLTLERKYAKRWINNKSDEALWREIYSITDHLWPEVVSFSDDLGYVPKDWIAARNDLLTLNRSLEIGELEK